MTFRILSYHDNGERRELTLEGWTVALDRIQSHSNGAARLFSNKVLSKEALIYEIYNAVRQQGR
jgi:hypothetical protein